LPKPAQGDPSSLLPPPPAHPPAAAHPGVATRASTMAGNEDDTFDFFPQAASHHRRIDTDTGDFDFSQASSPPPAHPSPPAPPARDGGGAHVRVCAARRG